MKIIEMSRQFANDACNESSSNYDGIFNGHLVPMEEFAKQLALKHGADVEIVCVSVWLHDIGSIRHGRTDHHETGAKIAESILKEWEYPAEKIKQVVGCILHHRGSQALITLNMEEQIVAEADAMSAFCNIHGLFRGAYLQEKLSQEVGRITVKEKLQRKWAQLCLPGSKEMMQARYDAAMLLLS